MLKFFLENNVPIIAPSKKFVQLGCLLSVNASNSNIGSQTADLIRYLDSGTNVKGENYASGDQVVLNMNIARKLGLSIPEEVREKSTIIE